MGATGIQLVILSIYFSNFLNAEMIVMESCSTKQPMKQVDFSKYTGRWYVVGSMPLDGVDQTRNLTCIQSVYRQLESGPTLEVVHTFVCKNERDHTLFLKTWAHPSHGGTDISDEGKLLTLNLNLNDFAVLSSASILDTDYENYAVEYVCAKVLYMIENYVTIYSRRPVLEEGYQRRIAEMLMREGFDPSDIIPMTQDCGATDCSDETKCVDTAKVLSLIL